MSMEPNPGVGEAPQVPDIGASEGSPNPADAAGTIEPNASVSGDQNITDPSGDDVVKDASYWERQSKHFQSLYDKQQEQFKVLRPVVDSGVAPQDILTAAQTYANMIQHPVLGNIAMEYARTGQVNLPTPSSDSEEEEEYMDPATRVMRDEISSLKQELASMRTDQGQVQRNQGVENFRTLNRNFLSRFEFDEQELEQIGPAIEQEFSRLMNTESGLKQVLGMNEKTYSMVALPIIEPYRDNAIRRKLQADASRIRGAATDAPIAVGTTGAEAGSPNFGNMSTREIAQKVLTEELSRAGKL